jgi:hypothetical protein
MLICFGASWPLAIFKTIKAKNPIGKSLPFLYLVLIGYIAGCLHKVFYSWNWVFWLFVINTLMVATDIVLTHYYNYINRRKTL